MPVNDLLEEKWRTQRQMAANADYSIRKMLDNAERIVTDMIKKQKVTLKYSTRKPSLNIKQLK